jgi:signal transduction histidine kinase
MGFAADNLEGDWLGRLVRVLVVFRLLVLLVTIVLLPGRGYTAEIGLAALVAAALSYLPLRHWPLIRRSLVKLPVYLLGEVLISTLILGLTGARSPFFFFTLGTAALAGAVYGRRGAIPFAVILVEAYEVIAVVGFPTMHPLTDVQSVLLVPALYPLAVAAGVAARSVIERGARTEALLLERTRALAIEQERLMVARELHDSLAKTVEGLAMTAMALPRRCERDPKAAALLATALAADAKRAALEARALMTGLRIDDGDCLVTKLRARAEALTARSGVEITVDCPDEAAVANLSDDVQHELVRIVGEAVINAVNHGKASHVWITLNARPFGLRQLVMNISDDGCGIAGPVDLEALRAGGHFGLVGMAERAASFGGALTYGTSNAGGMMIDVSVPRAKPKAAGHETDRLEVA